MSAPKSKYNSGAVVVTEWENESNGRQYATYTLERRYKDKSGEWKSATSFFDSDIPNLVSVLSKLSSELVRTKISPVEARTQNPAPTYPRSTSARPAQIPQGSLSDTETEANNLPF